MCRGEKSRKMTYDYDTDVRGQSVRVEVRMNVHEARNRALSMIRRDGHLQRNTKIKILPKKKKPVFNWMIVTNRYSVSTHIVGHSNKWLSKINYERLK